MKSLLIGLSLLIGCSSNITYITTKSDKIIRDDSLEDSVVSLVGPIEVSDENGVPKSIHYSFFCNAFYAKELNAESRLVTAKHCLDLYPIGSQVRYLSPTGYGFDSAIVEYKSATNDVAFMIPSETKNLKPIEVDPYFYPESNELAISYSPHFEMMSIGVVTGELTHGWFDTTQSVNYGWSGSPVINNDGNVWGVVSKCRLSPGSHACDRGYTIVSSIY